MERMTWGEKLFNIFNIVFLALLSLSAVYPFLYTLTISLSSAATASAGGLHIVPTEFNVTSYQMVLSNPNILTGFANTLFRTVVGTIASLIFTCICAYPLAQKNLPRRKMWTFLLLFTMLFHGGLVPTYLLIRGLGLLDNIWVYIIPGLTSAFNIIIVKNFFHQLPESFTESAQVDGASDWRILFQIYIPLSAPVLATVALWTAVGHWNAWFDALLYINSENKQVLQLFLRQIVVEANTALIERGVETSVTQYTPETVKAATVMITVLPLLIVYPFLQRFFTKGIMLGGIKG